MKAKNEIERWLKDEKFMAFANKRAKEEFFSIPKNNYIDHSMRRWQKALRITTSM